MKKLLKLLVPLCAAAPLMVAGATPDQPAQTNAAAPAAAPSDLFDNTVVAKGKGLSITRSQLDEAMAGVKSGAAARGQMIPPEQMVTFEQQMLQRLINQNLILAKASDADKTAGKKQFEDSLAKFKANTKQTDDEFNQKLSMQLRMAGITKDQWEKENTDQSTAMVVLQHELAATPTADDAKKYYDEHPASFEQPERVRAAHILLMTTDPATRAELSDDKKAEKKKELEGILKRARDGEDFAKLAKEYSEDPGSKDNGGEYTFARGRMVPEFEAAAFSLNTNQISDIITTAYGYHIIKLLEKFPAKKESYNGLDTKTVMTKPEGDAVTVREILKDQNIQEQLPTYMAKLQKDAGVEILDEKLKPAPPAAAGAVPNAAAAPLGGK